MSFVRRLQQAWAAQQSLLCVGLDPDPARLPDHLRASKHPIFEFGRAIVDATADLVCAFKPQIAYYAAARAEDQLEMTLAHIRQQHPSIPVILDAKRGDVGSTAEMYAREVFERYQADAVTVSPYLGLDSLQPYLDYAEKGVIVLCRTSNPGARDVQDIESGGRKLYQLIAEKAARAWNAKGNVLLVVGATYPEELGEIRAIVGDMPILVPGVGAQGGPRTGRG
jgi:orotidine-5'-phosphate decarboxylase